MTKRRWLYLILAVIATVGVAAGKRARHTARPVASPASQFKPAVDFGKLPLYFEPNLGQTAPEVSYIARSSGITVLLAGHEATFLLPARQTIKQPPGIDTQRSPAQPTPTPVRLSFVGAHRATDGAGSDRLPGISNYFIGSDKAKWVTDVPQYRQVTFRNVYDGIDAVYYGNQQHLEYDLVVAPGADPGKIELAWEGAKSTYVDAAGDLVLVTAAGNFKQRRPAVYQQIGDKRVQIEAKYRIGDAGSTRIQVAHYDARRPLVIDPVLDFATFLGGSGGDDLIYGLTLDSTGVYVTGAARSLDFPLRNAAQPTRLGVGSIPNAFVAKLDLTGSTLLYATYIGGSGGDQANGISVDNAGNAYVAGWTYSNDFPLFGATQSRNAGLYDAFVAKVNAAGNVLIYSTYLGGSGSDGGNSIVVDKISGNAFVAGDTYSNDLPITPGALYPSGGTYSSGFIAKFGPNGNKQFSTFFPATVTAVSLDSSGNLIAAGGPAVSGFPTTAGAYRQASAGGKDAFISKLQPNGSSLIASTLLGGTGDDWATGIALGPSGEIYVTGYTTSTDLPVHLGAVQANLQGRQSTFVGRLNSALTTLEYLTYLGGRKTAQPRGIGVDQNTGDAVVIGYTVSDNFPTLNALSSRKSGAGSTVQRTTDSGATWSGIDLGIPDSSSYFISVDPSNPNSILLGGADLYHSTDAGASWTRVLQGPNPNSPDFIPIVRSAGITYIPSAVSGALLQRSTDGGSTWTRIPTSAAFGSIYNFAAHPLYPQTIYVVTYAQGLQMSADGGATWSPMNQGLGNIGLGSVGSIAISTANPTILFATNSGQVYKSSNGGLLWAPMNNGIPQSDAVTDLFLHPSNQNVAYASSSYLLYKTVDGGQTWVPIQVPGRVLALAISPSNPNIVYAALNSSSLVRSTDGGSTWVNVGSGWGQTFTPYNLAVHPTSPAVVYSAGDISSSNETFVTELNATLSRFLYSTFLPDTIALSIAVDSAGDAYIGGRGYSALPLTPQAFQKTVGGAFVAKINPAGGTCAVVTTPASLVYPYTSGPYSSGTQTFSVVAPSGCSWNATSTAGWISFVGPSSGAGIGQVTVSTAPNSAATRTAIINISGAAVSVTQAGTNCGYSATPSRMTVGATGGISSLSLSAATGCPWQFSGYLPPWVAITSGGSGTGSGQVNLLISPNLYNTARSTYLYLNSDGYSYAQITQLGAGQSALAITKTHIGNFTQGQQNATYSVIISNAANASPTSGTVTFTETIPTGLTLVSMSGSGWTCPTAANTCTRSDALAPGASYPPITVGVNVASNAPSSVYNQVSVTGGGSSPATTYDSTIINRQMGQMSSPASGSTLPGPTATFNWSAATGATQYWLDVGNWPGSADFTTGSTTATSKTVGSLPCDGRTLYATLYTDFSGAGSWQTPQVTPYKSAICSSNTPAQMSSPVPGSTMTGGSASFTWTTGVGAKEYWLDIGNSPGSAEFSTGATTATARTVTTLPCDGRTLYATLYTDFSGARNWYKPEVIALKASSGSCLTPAHLISPPGASTLTGTSATFSWTPGVGATQYWLDIGDSPGTAEYTTGALNSTSKNVTGLPCDGRTIYATLYTGFPGLGWHSKPAEVTSFKAFSSPSCTPPNTPAQMTSPTAGSTLSGATVNFVWTAGIGAIQYWFDLGNSPGSAEYTTGPLNGTSKNVTGLPCDGRTLWATLYTSFTPANWQPPQVTSYKAASSCTPGSVP